MSPIPYDQRVEAVDAIHLPEDAAVQWLKDNSPTDPPYFFSLDNFKYQRDVVCFLYGRRHLPRLNLAIAKYGTHRGTLRRLFKNGTQTERLAVLSNVLIGPQDIDEIFSNDALILNWSETTDIVRNFNSNRADLTVLLSNPYIVREWLTSVIIGWKDIEGIDENIYLYLISAISDNPIIRNPRDETFLDGYEDYKYTELNFALAELLKTAPVTKDWAFVLRIMLEKLYLPFIPDELNGDLLDRWQEPKKIKSKYSNPYQDLRDTIVRKIILENHRSGVKESVSISHDDKAVRFALYKTLDPYELFGYSVRERDFLYPNFKDLDSSNLTDAQNEVVKVCMDCFSRDENDFIEQLLYNENLWKKKEDRDFLNNLCWDLAKDPHSSMDMPNLYRARKQYHLRENPEYFKDDEYIEIPEEETIEGRIKQICDNIEELRDEIKGLSQSDILDEQERNFERLMDQTDLIKNNIEALRSNAAELADKGTNNITFNINQSLESMTRQLQGFLALLAVCLLFILVIFVL